MLSVLKINFCIQIIFLLCFTVPVISFAVNDAPVKSEGDLLFYLDTSSFRARDNQTYQEFYYSLPFSELTFQNASRGLTDSINVKIQILDSLEQVLVTDSWPLLIKTKNWKEIQGRFLPDQFEMTISPGIYRLQMEIYEIHTGKMATANLDFEAVSFIEPGLTISQIQFSSKISSDSSQSKFVKNSLNVLPNPKRVFGKTLPVLYFYTEVYNLSESESSGQYAVSYQVTDLNGKVVKKFPSRTKKKRGDRALEVGAVNLATLDNAAYFLRVGVKDLDSGDSVAVHRGFWNKIEQTPPQVVTLENNATSAIKKMTDAERELHFRQLKYILPAPQIKLYEKLTPEGRERFLITLWQGLDPELTTVENEFWDEFRERVRYANQHYTAAFQDGWKTDCGRILIRYGIPNDITRRDVRGHAKPYQEWFYNREGGFRFIFVDEEGLGKYRLIYSSIETEYTDPNWRYLLGE